MTSERWQQVRALFEATVEQPVAERADYLERASSDDRTLRDEVTSLLMFEDLPNCILDSLPILSQVALADVLSGGRSETDSFEPEVASPVLAAGARIGPYEIVATLGSGAMGQVYRAHDTTLNRYVALKVLPVVFARDPERLARFNREARLLAALNHPNIAAIFGLEESHGVVALALELVEGQTLAARIAAGSIPLRETLAIARQIGAALEAAHDKGIIHRDLKPANIVIAQTGLVKVLDFGLAKACDNAEATLLGRSPGLTAADGLDRTILGTPAYMSPEQARGQPLDRRTDIWSLGCVLYEMLAGRPPFASDTISDTLATILEHEPDFQRLPGNTPPAIHRLLRRCLEKRCDRRLDSAAVARLDIDEAESPLGVPPRLGVTAMGRPRAATIAALSGVAILALMAASFMRPTPSAAAVTASRFVILPPTEPPLNLWGSARDLAVSPDGRNLVYRAGGSQTDGSPLMAREIDRLDARAIANVTSAYAPFFSPDSRWLGFFELGALKRIDIAGGPVVTICQIAGAPVGATWSDDNVITFATGLPKIGIWSVRADGGEPRLLATPDSSHEGDRYAFPSAIPGGSGLLFTVTTSGSARGSQIAVLDFKTGQTKTIIRGGSDAQYIESGHLIFAAGSSLRAVRFDPSRLELRGEPVTVVEDVLVKTTGAADYAVSHDGMLVYLPAELGQLPLHALVWVDRKGNEEPLRAPLRVYGPGRISPDGRRAVFGIIEHGSADLWMLDLAGGVPKRLTNAPGANGLPVWMPDGRAVIFSMSNEAGILNLYRLPVDESGPPEPVTSSRVPYWPTSVTPDGMRVIGFKRGGIITVPAGASAQSVDVPSLLAGNFAEVSPDGRYLAYQSSESGLSEVYVRPFPDVRSGPWQISTGGGSRPAWARNGRELFFLSASNAMMAVPVRTSGPTFVAGTPTELFKGKYLEPNPARHYDVSPDGRRFLMIRNSKDFDDSVTPAKMVVVLHWREELKQRVAAR